MIITTEWNMPGSVYQDVRYKEVTNGIVFPFYKLDNILKEDGSYAYQTEYVNGTYVGGTHLRRPSPMIYAYNYNFNIPHTAIIKKIELQQIVRQGSYTTRQNLKSKVIKLKTTASTTDGGGVNLNKAVGTKFATSPNWLDLVTEITPENSGIEITPTLVNSPEFGQIFQAQGIMEGDVNGYGSERGWDDVQIALMRMRITYDNPQPEINENNKKPTFKVTAGIKKTKKEKLAMDYPNQNTYVDITFERLPYNKVYYGGETPQLKIYSENNIYLFGKEKYTTYLPKTQHFTTTTKKPEKITLTVPVYPNWADNHGTIIIEWVENDTIQQKFVGLPITPWKELPDTFTEDTTSQGCIIANNKFDSCWAGVGGSYYIERCFDEIKPETQAEKDKYGIVDAEGYALFPDVSRYMQGVTGIEFPLGNEVTGECYTPMKFDPNDFSVTDSFNGAVEGEFTIREVQPYVIKKARKNPKNKKQYLKLDTSQSHRKAFSIEPEYYNPYMDKKILQGEGIVRIDFTMPPDIQSVRINAVITENNVTRKEDVTTHFMLEDYDLDLAKDKYFILAKYNFKELVTNQWGDEEWAAVFPSFDFEMDYFEYIVTTDAWQPIRYKTIVDANFNGTRTGTGTFYKLHYTPLIRVQKPIICTTNNTHTNILDITQNTWCTEPTGYIKEPCVSPESLKITPDITLTLSKYTLTWTETITATVTAMYNDVPINTDAPIPITDNTNKTLGIVTLENGTGSVKIKPQSTDVNKITATWGETTRFFETKATRNVTVNKITPTITVTPNKDNPEYNQTFTLSTTAYYTDLTTQQKKPIASQMTLTIPGDNNQSTTQIIQTNNKGLNTTSHHITTRPSDYIYSVTYEGTKNIATKTTNVTIHEQKGTLTIKIDPTRSTSTERAMHKQSLHLYTQLFDANTKEEITEAPAPFDLIPTDTPTAQKTNTSTSPVEVIGNAGEAYHGEVIDGKPVGYDDRPKQYYIRIYSHPYYDKTTDKEYDANGNVLDSMISNGIPVTLTELNTMIKTPTIQNEAGVIIGTNSSFTLPEQITVKGQLLFERPAGHTVPYPTAGSTYNSSTGTRWYPLKKRLSLTGTTWSEEGDINRPVNNVSLQIMKNDNIIYREFTPDENGYFTYKWDAWNDTSETTPTLTNKIRIQYRKQQSGIFKGYDSPEYTITVTKANTAVLNYSTSVKNGEVTITGKIVWYDSKNVARTNWDRYSNNEKIITPIIDGNYQGYRFYPSNDGTFTARFIPSKNKTGTKPIYLQFNSTTLFNPCTSSTTNIKLS